LGRAQLSGVALKALKYDEKRERLFRSGNKMCKIDEIPFKKTALTFFDDGGHQKKIVL
jgi:hypothetical protein